MHINTSIEVSGIDFKSEENMSFIKDANTLSNFDTVVIMDINDKNVSHH